MKIVTVQFDYPGKDRYKRLLTAFRNSVRYHMPDAELVHVHLKPPVDMPARKKSFASNTVKLQAWIDQLNATTEPVLLADCDMLMNAPVGDVWNYDFDLAYTYREESIGHERRVEPLYKVVNGRKVRTGPKRHPMGPGTRFGDKRWPPFNGGVMFVRPTEPAIRFMRELLSVNNQMMKDQRFHQQYRDVYGGLNQAAFGYMMEHSKDDGLKAMKLPCSEWNACELHWSNYNGRNRLIHIKSSLRKYVLGEKECPPQYQSIVKLWSKFEKMKFKEEL